MNARVTIEFVMKDVCDEKDVGSLERIVEDILEEEGICSQILRYNYEILKVEEVDNA